jgi:hypothetical protein
MFPKVKKMFSKFFFRKKTSKQDGGHIHLILGKRERVPGALSVSKSINDHTQPNPVVPFVIPLIRKYTEMKTNHFKKHSKYLIFNVDTSEIRALLFRVRSLTQRLFGFFLLSYQVENTRGLLGQEAWEVGLFVTYRPEQLVLKQWVAMNQLNN